MFSRQGKKGSGSTKVVKIETIRHFYKFLDPYRPKDPDVNVSIDIHPRSLAIYVYPYVRICVDR